MRTYGFYARGLIQCFSANMMMDSKPNSFDFVVTNRVFVSSKLKFETAGNVCF